jgi:isoleucyl-tRNA synthetase
MGENEAILGLNVLYEVLLTMTLIMAPFTPYFSEYLYQALRKLQPLYGNTDAAVPADAMGKAESVHYLMLPTLDTSRLNPRAEARFKTLQTAVRNEYIHVKPALSLLNIT